MPFISITFTEPINVSCQPGDQVYSTNVSSTDSNLIMDLGYLSGSYLIGTVSNLINPDGLINGVPIQLVVEWTGSSAPVIGNGDFLMFSKNKLANTSGITGYYAEVDFANDSREKAELFSVSALVELSSQ